MKTNPLYSEWVLLGLMLVPFIYLATIYNQLPDSVPFHYDYNGQPDRYGPKEGLVLLFGGLTIMMYFMFRYIPKLDPKQNLNSTNYLKIRLLITVFWSILLVFLWYTSTQGVMGETFLSCLLAGVFLLLAGIGNLLYSVKPNYFVGIRTPWTLENETVWRKTHQWAAPVWVVGGLLGAILAFIVPGIGKPILVALIVLGLAGGSILYSYLVYKQEKVKHL